MKAEDYKAAVSFWNRHDCVEMPAEQIKKYAWDYIQRNAVCALATGIDDFVRCTPLEYSFHDDKFWIFTEGGEKFVGLEKNDNVSLAVFDCTTGFDKLKSVQLMGKAKIIEPMTEEYVAHAEYKKVPVASLQKLAYKGTPIHLLCIEPTRIDVIFSEFKKQGFEIRQTLNLTSE